jgi:hypothetical protein
MSSKRLFADLIKRCDSVYSEAGGRDENAEKLKRARKDKVMALRLDLQTAVQETRKVRSPAFLVVRAKAHVRAPRSLQPTADRALCCPFLCR